MTLEDHFGDVIRKAREGSGVALEAAARASGLSAEAYGRLEESGQAPGSLNFQGLADAVGLNGKKLARFAQGWHPQKPDLSLWREIRLITMQGNSMTVNCYLVWDEVTREAALFDTGFEAGPILAEIEENQLQLAHIFITHSHYDHMGGLAGVREKFPKARLHSSSKNAPIDQRNRANDFIHLGSLRITNRDTPGHAEDGVSYIIGNFPEDAPNVVIVGDAIFAGSIGGAKQAFDLARQKIRDQILSLPPATLIGPGHGPYTTVQEEKEFNPFFS